MSDVEYWGQNSYWEIIDTFIATILTLVAGPLVYFARLTVMPLIPFILTLFECVVRHFHFIANICLINVFKY